MTPRHATGLDKSLPHLSSYLSDRRERDRVNAEIAHNRALVQSAIDAGMEPHNQRQRAAWAMEKRNA